MKDSHGTYDGRKAEPLYKVDLDICLNCGHDAMEHEGAVGACTMDESDAGGEVCACEEFFGPEDEAAS